MFPQEKISGKIKELLEEKGFRLQSISLFGSVLDETRFDRNGQGTSDIDLLAVVKEYPDSFTRRRNLSIFPGFSTAIGGFVSHRLRYHHTAGEEWDGGRNIDLLLIDSRSALALIAKEVSTEETSAFVVALLRGKEIFRR